MYVPRGYNEYTRVLATARVARGARWLDAQFPGWESRINLSTLRLFSAEHCICGQVFGRRPLSTSGYAYAEKHLFPQANSWITELVGPTVPRSLFPWVNSTKRELRALRVSIELGFTHDEEVEFSDLQTAWTTLLIERKEARLKGKVEV